MRVLLIVDVQNDFCPGGALAVPGGDQIVPIVNRLMSEGGYDLVIASRDWHPANHSSFADQYADGVPFSERNLGGRSQTLWPRHCVQGSHGAELRGDLEHGRIHQIIDKGSDPSVDSYSAFFDNKRDARTSLIDTLEQRAHQRGLCLAELKVDIVGLALDYCVGFTALDARSLGLGTRVIVDATRAVNITPGDDLKMLRTLTQAGCEIVESREVLSSMNRQSERQVHHGRGVTLSP